MESMDIEEVYSCVDWRLILVILHKWVIVGSGFRWNGVYQQQNALFLSTKPQ